MATRRVKDVSYDEDEWWGGGDDDWDWEGYTKPKPKAKQPAASKAKAAGGAPKAAAKAASGGTPKAAAGGTPKAAASTPKAGGPSPKAETASSASGAAASPKAAAPVKSAVVDELLVALGSASDADRVTKALASCKNSAEDAFLEILEEALDSGRWEPSMSSSKPATTSSSKAKASAPAPQKAPAASPGSSESGTKQAAFKEPAAQKSEESAAPKKAASKKKSAPSEAAFAPAEREAATGGGADTPSEPATPAAADEDDARPSINLVVVGHVDAGKSTLMGHLLCLVGNVTAQQLHKFEKESKQMGKASFAYAWVLDEGADERERGVTIDVCVKHFTTTNRRFTILDAPGHRDFVPNMVQGAVQADAALLVADCSHFESGFERGGQTKEHLQLVRSLGISSLIVAVNKLDTCDWSQEKYEYIKSQLNGFIVGPECGYKASAVTYLPLSGFTGENMLERKDEALKQWWTGPTLIEALDQLPPPPRAPSTGPFRLCISDLYKSGASSCVSGKIEGGTVSPGQTVLLLPSGEQAKVKSLQSHDKLVRSGHAGDYMDAVILPVEPQFANIGGVLCDPRNPVPLVDGFQAQILVFDVDIPIMRGQQFMCYLHTETLTAIMGRLEKLMVKGKPQEGRPKCLQKGNVAIVHMQVSRKVCLEPKPAGGAPATCLSRLVLRDRGKTVAAGMVLAVA